MTLAERIAAIRAKINADELQDPDIRIRYLVLPVARVVELQNANLTRRLLALGVPILERTGVSNPGRRALWAHRFNPEQIMDINALAENADPAVPLTAILKDDMPLNWRPPLLP